MDESNHLAAVLDPRWQVTKPTRTASSPWQRVRNVVAEREDPSRRGCESLIRFFMPEEWQYIMTPLTRKRRTETRAAVAAGGARESPHHSCTTVNRVRATAGLLGWKGDVETVERIALDPEFGVEECPSSLALSPPPHRCLSTRTSSLITSHTPCFRQHVDTSGLALAGTDWIHLGTRVDKCSPSHHDLGGR